MSAKVLQADRTSRELNEVEIDKTASPKNKTRAAYPNPLPRAGRAIRIRPENVTRQTCHKRKRRLSPH